METPPGDGIPPLSLEERLQRLEDAGVIAPRNPNERPLPPPIPIERGLAQRILREHRDAYPPNVAALFEGLDPE